MSNNNAPPTTSTSTSLTYDQLLMEKMRNWSNYMSQVPQIKQNPNFVEQLKDFCDPRGLGVFKTYFREQVKPQIQKEGLGKVVIGMLNDYQIEWPRMEKQHLEKFEQYLNCFDKLIE